LCGGLLCYSAIFLFLPGPAYFYWEFILLVTALFVSTGQGKVGTCVNSQSKNATLALHAHLSHPLNQKAKEFYAESQLSHAAFQFGLYLQQQSSNEFIISKNKQRIHLQPDTQRSSGRQTKKPNERSKGRERKELFFALVKTCGIGLLVGTKDPSILE
jgi:hypothetical protein